MQKTLVGALAIAMAMMGCGDDAEPAPFDAGTTTSADGGGGVTRPDAGTMPPADGGTVQADGGGMAMVDSGTPPTGLACDTLVPGENTGFMVNGTPRMFFLDLPSGAMPDGSGNWPVVFNWHGLGGNAPNMRTLIQGSVDNETMPFIGVTPEDTNFVLEIPFVGPQMMDWDVFMVDPNNNLEIALFDAVLTCLEERYGTDEDHIHSMGFSLGGIVTDMLGVARGDVLASTATYSGGYLNNPANTMGLISMVVSWPDFVGTRTYPQLLLHGGPTDNVGASVVTIQFDDFANNDAAMLGNRGHDVVLCNHNMGHTTAAPGMGTAQFVQFFADHDRSVTDSPYATSGLPGFAPYCNFRGAP